MTKLQVSKDSVKVPLLEWQMQSTQPPAHVYCYPEDAAATRWVLHQIAIVLLETVLPVHEGFSEQF